MLESCRFHLLPQVASTPLPSWRLRFFWKFNGPTREVGPCELQTGQIYSENFNQTRRRLGGRHPL